MHTQDEGETGSIQHIQLPLKNKGEIRFNLTTSTKENQMPLEEVTVPKSVFDALQREVHDYRNLMDTLIGFYNKSEEAKHTYSASVMREYIRSTQLHIRKWQTEALERARNPKGQ